MHQAKPCIFAIWLSSSIEPPRNNIQATLVSEYRFPQLPDQVVRERWTAVVRVMEVC